MDQVVTTSRSVLFFSARAKSCSYYLLLARLYLSRSDKCFVFLSPVECESRLGYTSVGRIGCPRATDSLYSDQDLSFINHSVGDR